jgi:hypothetical protein
VLRVVLFSIWALAGTLFLFMNVGNVWLGVGVALFSYASAVKTLAMAPGVRHRLGPTVAIRIWAIGTTVAAGLGCIGSFMLGGPIGWLGVFLSLRIGLTGAWVLRQMAASPSTRAPLSE